ncbi:hypothetical protein [Deinococcus sp. QL22]|uniref:hypothetical protein n=1 Tax=Deinococcus sp. QL22 TaxID=2939437 RepID=UPI002017D7CA|nr:hypothetical protein [Deinococcus sp. QL22]UQN09810.1 hypothetical protein M1R55_25430 [Deinococcus sp. QL22]
MEYAEDQVLVRELWLGARAARVFIKDCPKHPQYGEVVDLGQAGKMQITAYHYHAHLNGAEVLVQDAGYRMRQPESLVEDYQAIEGN